ncbi:hypothetical protein B0H14DRAFT_3174479 [Mycena olivaceomarginata]|nr:hypothetical protein B0H14DRAFT_3174479 [Mycena olivaceomarginata]
MTRGQGWAARRALVRNARWGAGAVRTWSAQQGRAARACAAHGGHTEEGVGALGYAWRRERGQHAGPRSNFRGVVAGGARSSGRGVLRAALKFLGAGNMVYFVEELKCQWISGDPNLFRGKRGQLQAVRALSRAVVWADIPLNVKRRGADFQPDQPQASFSGESEPFELRKRHRNSEDSEGQHGEGTELQWGCRGIRGASVVEEQER